MIQGSIQEEDITIVNIYAPNIGAPQYIRQTLTDIKGEIDSNTIIVGGFNTPLTATDRSSKQKINKEIQVLTDTLDEMDLIGVSGVLKSPTIIVLLSISPFMSVSVCLGEGNGTPLQYSCLENPMDGGAW